ncbi:HD domain-containing protein [Flavihumibacter petaseus]|uniref:Metal-dependent HD superfamily phosphohydrolase n=1 Tax=Flavihumibacter petaseus NBRC 106054 TaxID=1220578 RepID=A0A0E9MYK3_9BACT|nr:hypothetical protein [Flavihumibacter petaseus]GAO42486.1 hypothetical protein FPE01S_01_15000 [Flavihumibacter petaseus NBRC 106054]
MPKPISGLESAFRTVIQTATASTDNPEPGLATQLWNEVQAAYSRPARTYHNLQHLEDLFGELLAVKEQIQDWDMLVLATVYHDFVYNPLKKDNEEKSAKVAVDKLNLLHWPKDRAMACYDCILATRSHQPGNSSDINYFTDADLSILGQPSPVFAAYAANIRREYKFFPDLAYGPGRRRVLSHFLHMERIYKTPHFFDRYEKAARENLQQEMLQLSRI